MKLKTGVALRRMDWEMARPRRIGPRLLANVCRVRWCVAVSLRNSDVRCGAWWSYRPAPTVVAIYRLRPSPPLFSFRVSFTTSHLFV